MKEKMAYGLKEAAKMCGVSVHTMQALVNSEGFPAFRAGRRWMIPRDELVAWMARQAAERSTFDTSRG